ncbi:MAG: MBL fold metallo-hydrolase [Gemmatimonadaceae bacterium]
MKLTFLGTGTSFGVPQIGCGCAVCHSTDARDKRTRSGAIIESRTGTRVLIDTPPELRLQMVAANVGSVDAVVFTHAHADHIHGIDDVRAFTIGRATPLPMFGSAQTLDDIAQRVPYILNENMKPLPGTFKPEARGFPIAAGETIYVNDLTLTAIDIPHGRTPVFAYRAGPLGYVTDAKTIPEEAFAALEGVDTLVINALFRKPNPTHLSLPESLAAAERIGARRTYLTHLTHDNFHAQLDAELPDHISPAYDGLVVEIPE